MPYVVQGAERFFERAEVRQAMVALRAATRSTSDGDAPCGRPWSRRWRRSAGGPTQPPPGGAARERWEALAALVGLAEEFAAGRRAGTLARVDGVQRGAGPPGRRCSTRRPSTG